MKKEMNVMIFDLQLFDEAIPETVTATGSDELITITIADSKVKATHKIGGATASDLTVADATNGVIAGVDAGAGDDTISVSADAATREIVIIGGKGSDKIDIATEGRAVTGGNIYQYGEGEGYDTITGWNSNDTLEITSGIADAAALANASMMSADGNNFILKVGTNTITFQEVTPGTQVKVKIGENITPITVPRLRQGTTESEVIDNTTGQDARKEGAAGGIYVIDAGAGYDTVKNDASFVSIVGGAGNDSIEIKAKDASTLASNVTINAGTGNDTVDTSNNTITGGTFGNVVYEYNEGDGNDVIVGFHANDTIKIATAAASLTADAIKKAAKVSGNDFVINVGTGSITIKDAVGGTNFYLYVKNGDSGTDTLIKFKDDDTTTVIPKEINGTSVGEELNATQDEYLVNALEGNDTVKVTAAKVTVNAGDGNDFITLTGGTNVLADATAADAAKAVVINGGAGNDTIDVTADKKVGAGTDAPETLATHIYEYKEGDGNDVILGFNESDTIKITTTTSAIDATYLTNNVKYDGTDLTINIGNGSIVLKDVTGGKNLNVYLGDTEVTGLDKIPQKITGTDSVDEYNVTVEGYTIEALAGNDKITVAAGKASVNAGAGNDVITLKDGTNVKADGGTINDETIVTIIGGADNDIIDATADKKTVSNVDKYALRTFTNSAQMTAATVSKASMQVIQSLSMLHQIRKLRANFQTTARVISLKPALQV